MVKAQNQLIQLLPRAERQRLIAASDMFELNLSDVLCEPGDVTRYAYFPVDGFISLLKTVDESRVLEVGMVGREGMVGVQIALGMSVVPLRAVVQGQGVTLRIGVGELDAYLADSPALRRVLNRYVYVLMTQFATSAACLRHHQIGQRLARWLLMMQDRARTDNFPVTQEFLAFMLGVRRVSITAAASELQHAGHIRYARGDLTVLHRAGLEEIACSCYTSDQRAYTETFS
ncbi:Crp/Fnr family transcriptional regulator [Variovorax sp. J22P271]|uniref:Crp/Fnr family transcriptional regulator n=1 Tax=Variovorax davisae TaxID=3053515 RepID=UPI002576CDC9|nr:Crp/Fnr family transcriptional regulator [Variovorax sp. J22P271]MDM0032113.1 Crp/Fnr family transcriptional regulator [Variovorax sp. J22P271]